MEVYSSPQELRAKVMYYLNHDQERETIADKGYKKVLAFESYHDKMRTLFATIGEPIIAANQQ